MEIEGYVLGSPLLVQVSFGMATTSVGPRVPPLAPSLLPSLPIDWAEVGHNGDWGVSFGIPITCGAKFWVTTTSVGAKLTPSSLPLLPLAPLAPNGQGRVGVCYTMFWGPHHLCGGKLLGGKLGVRGSEGGKREWGEWAKCYTRF